MSKIFIKNINFIKKNDVNELSEYRIKKSQSYINEKDTLLCLAAGIALNEGLKEFELKEKDLIINYNENGKPSFKDYNDIKFNLSHSKEYAIAVISNEEVGCDIEFLRKYNDKISKKYFSKEEQEYIDNSLNKDESFTRIWVLKESFLKALGIGLINNMKEISIIPNDDKIKINQKISKKNWFLKEMFLDKYYIAVCEEII